MARLRNPVALSEASTSLSQSRSQPANLEKIARMRSKRSSSALSGSMPATASAPALIIGLRGLPVPGSRLIELHASPDGSTPTRSSTADAPTGPAPCRR